MSVRNSGYPLQIRLEKWVEETRQHHKWRVSATEHRWVNSETREDNYIDLILERENFNLRLVIECKRIVGSWTFLLPMAQSYDVRELRALSVNYQTYKHVWNTLHLSPESSEASYCVLETGGKKDSRTIEKIANELILSLEHLAIEETSLLRPLYEKLAHPPATMFYLPVIVTTATLQKMNFAPSSVDIKTGKITESATAPVQYIRFQKNLASIIEYEKPKMYRLHDLNKENNRTVFVVHAESFIDFLGKING